MRTVKIEWRNEFEYCILFYTNDKLQSIKYSQTIDVRGIASWLRFDINLEQ